MAESSCVRALVELIHEFSETYWAAGWNIGVEYDLWQLIESYRRQRVPAKSLIRRIAAIQETCDIWVRWDEDDPRHVLIDGRPLVIMSTREWHVHLMEKAL